MEALFLLMGSLTVLVGFTVGRHTRRVGRPAVVPKSTSTTCGCGHGKHTHIEGFKACSVGIKTPVYVRGKVDHYEHRECACRVFVPQVNAAENERVTELNALLRRVLDANALLPQLPLDLVTDLETALKES